MLRIRQFLGRRVDNSPLIVFRIGFGFLAAAESWGAIMTGWVRRNMVEPDFTFNFIGFDWLQVFQGQPMYAYYGLMGLAGIFIMLGLFYRGATTLFFLLWSGCYLMQKSSYNNHYYLLMLLSAIMIFVPAHKSRSLDVKYGFVKAEDDCHYAYVWFFIFHLGLVYLFASFNKIYPGWLEAKPISIWFTSKSNMPVIGPLLAQEWFQFVIAYGGIVYDGLIVFILLHPRTRRLGFYLSLFFNLFNSLVFQIGIFPYLMILWNVFFYDGTLVRRRFFREKKEIVSTSGVFPFGASILILAYFLVQILLPLRHWTIPGDVNWTEEGHRLSWRMMLRAKSGTGMFRVENGVTGESEMVPITKLLTSKQRMIARRNPDVAWQFAQKVEEIYEAKGWADVRVYAKLRTSLNGSSYQTVIDPEVDLTEVDWNYFWHNHWILTSQNDD